MKIPKYPCSKDCISYAICNSKIKDHIRHTLAEKSVSGNYATDLAINSILCECPIFFKYIMELSVIYKDDTLTRNEYITSNTITHYNISYLKLMET